MDTTEAVSVARGLMNLHGLGHWTLTFNRAKRRAGYCNLSKQVISLSYIYVQHNGRDEITDTVLHEIAHALAGPHHHHDAVWKAICIRIGAKPKRCGTYTMPKGRWKAQCSSCQKVFHRHRKPKWNGYTYCGKCGPTDGKLLYTVGELSNVQ